jgi:hypothetical protein
MRTSIIGLTVTLAIISAALASSIVTISYSQKPTNLSKNYIKGAITSI